MVQDAVFVESGHASLLCGIAMASGSQLPGPNQLAKLLQQMRILSTHFFGGYELTLIAELLPTRVKQFNGNRSN